MKYLIVKKWIWMFSIIWVTKSFFTIDGMINFLNTLPIQRQMEAKVFVINSTRSFMGNFSDPYYLIYRIEKGD